MNSLQKICHAMGTRVRAVAERAFALGVQDGATMARESGSAQAPEEGWDGAAINALGKAKFMSLLYLPNRGPDWIRERDFTLACRAYSLGCQEGAERQLRATEDDL